MESWAVVPLFHDLSYYSDFSINLTCHMLAQSQDIILPACSVLSLGDGLLGSPVPRVLVAITLNSYSVQGNKSTTVAVSAFPSTSTGAIERYTLFILQCKNVKVLTHYVKMLYNTSYAVLQFIKLSSISLRHS